MKKIVTASLVAICALVASQQQASAWSNTRFSMGVTYESQSGNNSCLWGAHRNGQVPAPAGFAPTPYSSPTYGYGHVPYITPPAPVASMYIPQPQSYAGMPYGASFDSSFAGTPMNYGSPYQFANYPRPMYYYPSTWSYGR